MKKGRKATSKLHIKILYDLELCVYIEITTFISPARECF